MKRQPKTGGGYDLKRVLFLAGERLLKKAGPDKRMMIVGQALVVAANQSP
jgi:hypothetical protein